MSELVQSFINALKVIEKDWDALPGLVKLSFVVALFLILAGLPASQIGLPEDFLLGQSVVVWFYILLLFFTVIVPILYWVQTKLKIIFYRRKYY